MAIEVIPIALVLFVVGLLVNVVIFRTYAFMQIPKWLARGSAEPRKQDVSLKDNDPNKNRTWGGKNI